MNMEVVKRIVVADTGAEFRENLVRTLTSDPGLQVIGHLAFQAGAAAALRFHRARGHHLFQPLAMPLR